MDGAGNKELSRRLYEEVFAVDGSFEERIEQARNDLTPDYFKLFDGHLVDDHLALLSDPSDIGAKVDELRGVTAAPR